MWFSVKCGRVDQWAVRLAMWAWSFLIHEPLMPHSSGLGGNDCKPVISVLQGWLMPEMEKQTNPLNYKTLHILILFKKNSLFVPCTPKWLSIFYTRQGFTYSKPGEKSMWLNLLQRKSQYWRADNVVLVMVFGARWHKIYFEFLFVLHFFGWSLINVPVNHYCLLFIIPEELIHVEGHLKQLV